MEFFDHLVTLWNAPSVDLSDAMLSEEYINMSKSEVMSHYRVIREEVAAQLEEVLTEFAKLKAMEDAGLSDVSPSSATVDFVDGFAQIETKDLGALGVTNSVRELIFDESDNMDYGSRYFSIDAHNRTNDVADVAFFRIVKANDLKTVVFPQYTEYIMPGISNSKFRQFILLSLSEATQERMQIVETSEDFQLLFYGKRPEVLQVQGILKNTMDNPWSMNMLFMWDNFMRGTKLAEQGNIFQLYADKELYSGYPFGFQRSKAAPNDFIVNFSFSFIVKERLSSQDLKLTVDNATRTTL
jgi:hypothetical protein